jgi:triosephosphate isomerase
VYLGTALQAAAGSRLQVSAQNCHEKEKGAFTGETSVGMLKVGGFFFFQKKKEEKRKELKTDLWCMVGSEHRLGDSGAFRGR